MTNRELRAWRKSRALTQRQAAALLRTPHTTFRNWEAGRSKVPGVVSVAIDGLAYRLIGLPLANSTNRKDSDQ